jgi:hypothetical protein
MAEKNTVRLVDDLDGSTDETVSTVRFGLDDVHYEIDLTEMNCRRLVDSLAGFVAAARRTARTPPSRGKRRDRERAQEIRAWAKLQGYDLSDRGRLPDLVMKAFESARVPRW